MESNWRDTSWSGPDGEKIITITDVVDSLREQIAEDVSVLGLSQQLPPLPTCGSKRVRAASLDHPIIIVVKSGGQYQFILDGNHRLQKAMDEKAEGIRAKLLDLDNPETPEAFKKMFEGK